MKQLTSSLKRSTGTFLLFWFMIAGSSAIADGTYLDKFDSISYSNSDGTLIWSEPWVEIGESDGVDHGKVRVRQDNHQYYVLHFENLDSHGAKRKVDLSGATSVTLSFEYERVTGDESLKVQLWNKANGQFEDIAHLNDTHHHVHTWTHVLDSKYISDESEIRILTYSGTWSHHEIYFIDHVKFDVIKSDVDTDGDGVINSLDIDDDNDGIIDTAGQADFTQCDTRPNPKFGAAQGPHNYNGSNVNSPQIGDQFLYEDVMTGIDAIITLADSSTASVTVDILDDTTDGYDDHFQPRITYGAASDWVEFTIEFVQAGTTTAAISQQYVFTTIDNDGDEFIVFDNTGAKYVTDSPTKEHLYHSGNGIGGIFQNGYHGDGTSAGGVPIDRPEYHVSALYLNTHSFDFRVGGGTNQQRFHSYSVDPCLPRDQWSSSNFPAYVDMDTDGDGFVDRLDLDSDNDGIPDNVEGQSTAGYTPPTGNDSDNDGLDDAYDLDNSGPANSIGIIPYNKDGVDEVDFQDLDSDNDGESDCKEGLKSTSANGTKDCPVDPNDTNIANDDDGMIDWVDNTDSVYDDPNGRVDTVIGNGSDGDLYNVGGDTTEVDFRDDAVILPVTIAYAYPQVNDSTLELDFSTATETANVGFNFYAIKGKKWIKLNKDPMIGAMDSLDPIDYRISLSLPENKKIRNIGIAGVDVNGIEDRHGPFKINKQSGEKVIVTPIDWSKSKAQFKADRKAKKIAKKARKESRRATKKDLRGLLKEETANIDVSNDGLYVITHNDLMAQDIDLTGFKATEIALSFKDEGTPRLINGLNKNGKWTEESNITFTGEAPKGSDSIYLAANRYQLSLNKKLVIKASELELPTINTIVFDNNNKYSLTIPGDDPFYDEMFYTRGEGKPGSVTRTLVLSEAPKKGDAELTVYVSAFSNLTHNLSVTLNGNTIATVSEPGYKQLTIKTTVNSSILNEGANTLSITAHGQDDKIDVFYYDKAVLTYDDGISNSVMTPIVSTDEKITEKSLRINRGTNYLIIAHSMFIGDILDRYVAQRQGEGWKIQVVSVEDIYDAYGYGMATPEAIKSYLKIAKGEEVTHVQLVGSASYDYHDYLGTGAISYIPSLYTFTAPIVNYTPCDSCLVADENGIPQMAIGRWPVRTLDGLEAVINKTLQWHPVSKNALLIADATETGANFAKQLDSAADKLTDHDITRVYMDTAQSVEAAREQILTSLNDGTSLVSFSGHSSPAVWSFKGLLKYSDVASVQNEGRTTLALPLACYTNYADSPSVDSMAHQFLAKDESGFVAIYGAATLSQFEQNSAAITRVIDYLKKGETLGEAVRKTKADLGTAYIDIIRNSNVLGDVTLRME